MNIVNAELLARERGIEIVEQTNPKKGDFSTLIKAFTDAIINPILNRFQGGSGIGLGIQLGDKGNAKTFLDEHPDVAREIEAKIYAALGISQKSVKPIEGRQDPALQAVEPAPAVEGKAA